MALKKREFTPESGNVDTYAFHNGSNNSGILFLMQRNYNTGFPEFQSKKFPDISRMNFQISRIISYTYFQFEAILRWIRSGIHTEKPPQPMIQCAHCLDV